MSEPNYVVEAFKFKPNLAAVAGGVGAAIVFSSMPLLGIVAVLEVGYLYGMSSNPRFRRALRARGGRL